jgi:hypothetical protein
MDTQKTRQAEVARKAPVQVEIDLGNVQMRHSELKEVDELAVDEDFTAGGDPYNSTGKHVIIKQQPDDAGE